MDASRVGDLFAKAGPAAVAIVFVDELDSMEEAHAALSAGGLDKREQTLNKV